MQEVNAISGWQSRKKICLVNKYYSHFLQGICADILNHITYFISTPLIEIKNNNGFDIFLILSQLLFLISINSELILEIAVMTPSESQQLECLTFK